MASETKKANKTAWALGGVLALCWLALGFPRVCPASAPYSLDAAFHASGGSPYLAVSVTPLRDDVYLYASASQARGKVTEISASVDGVALGSSVIFPRGVEKPDPLESGAMTRVFEGPFYAVIPVSLAGIEGREVLLRLSGLACSAVNCTPLDISRRIAVPEVFPASPLPRAAEAVLRAGVTEAMPDPRAGGESGALPSLPATPGILGGAGEPLATPAAFLEKLRPEPFTPGLEVFSLGKAALLGFLAGILLNLMPCVLPVLGIKIGSLLQHGAGSAETVRRFRRHQAFFALGILAWFTVLAGLFHWLDLAWGQVFQSPAVVLALAVALLLLALNMFGALSLPLIDFRMGNPKNPDAQAFTGGFAATLLATPCGGPLLGGVLSWALMQPFGILALALGCVGLGMAFPYLLLAAFPALAARFPRPGRWMGVLEQVLGFLLLGTVAYLVSFLPPEILPRVVAALVLAAFGGWLWGRGRLIPRALGVVCVVLACVWPLMERPAEAVWTAYSHRAFSEELGRRLILVDFTADWCPTCKVVEATALTDDALREWKAAYDPALFRVDLTRPNPEGEALLRAVGSVSIPVIAVFGKGEDMHSPLVLRDVVTRGQVAEALKKAATRR